MNKELREKIYKKYNGRCAYCGKQIEYKDMQVDHLMPQRNGGTDKLSNLMPSCRLCNHYKRAHALETFRDMIAKIPDKLQDNYIYKVALRYSNIQVCNDNKIVFYFEKCYENGGDDCVE
jgi:5-methylcytosine-specific restriction endonuclease McrA